MAIPFNGEVLNSIISTWPTDWDPTQYSLLDFGMQRAGQPRADLSKHATARKLELFGGVLLDRPSPAADGNMVSHTTDWSSAQVRLDGGGQLEYGVAPTGAWQATYGPLFFNLKLTPFGHVGLFPEQHVSWNWLRERAVSLARPDRPLQALNLFAYTGGTTMSLAHAGVQVTHVDASAPAVRWARDNARDSGLADKPVRWIVEDARKFVTRAVRRGTQFDMIILDPPSYGHGPTGKLWKIEADLAPLLAECLGLLAGPTAVLLTTGHSEHCNERFVVDCLTAYDGKIEIETGRSGLGNINGKILDAGFFVRAIVKS